MINLKSLLCLTLILLLFSCIENRPLRSPVEKRRLSESIKALKQEAKEAKRSLYAYPYRVSPGGPDPQHHFTNN